MLWGDVGDEADIKEAFPEESMHVNWELKRGWEASGGWAERTGWRDVGREVQAERTCKSPQGAL